MVRKVTTFKVFTDASSRYRAILEKVDGGTRLRKVYPSSIGAVIKDGSRVVGSISQRIGFSDSNYAEFMSMFIACRYLIDHDIRKVDFYADSLNLVLMINQGIIGGEDRLRRLSYSIFDSLKHFDHFTMTWISRSLNKEAHTMAERAFKVG